MPEENVNTMSENDEKQKAGSRLDAMSMHKSDVEALTNKINDLAHATIDGYVKLHMAQGYTSTEEALNAFADELLFGTLYDFREKNKWLKGVDYGDLDKMANADAGQTAEDLMAAMEMWRILNGKGMEMLNNVYTYIQEVLGSGILRRAYRVLREDMIMRDNHYSDILDCLNNAFEEYDAVMKRYKQSSIYDEIPARKENGYMTNYKLVEERMLADIAKTRDLSDIIHDRLSYPDPYWFNYFTVIDGDTKILSRLPEGSKFDEELVKIANLNNEVCGYFESTGKMLTPLSKNINDVFYGLRVTFKDARDIANNYRFNTSEFPYTIMHYSSSVKRVGGSLMSLKDPVTNGTQYTDMSWALLQNAEKTASEVAKQAP